MIEGGKTIEKRCKRENDKHLKCQEFYDYDSLMQMSLRLHTTNIEIKLIKVPCSRALRNLRFLMVKSQLSLISDL